MTKIFAEGRNKELLKGFERRRNLSLQEFQKCAEKQYLTEGEDNQIMEVDNIFEYMNSLGYSTLDEIRKKYNI